MIDKIISITIVTSLLIIIPFVSGNYENMNFKYVNIGFDEKNSTVSITINNSDFMNIKFTKLYAGSLNSPFMGWGNLNNMKISKEYGKNDVMGNYIHIKMWKNTTIIEFFPWHKNHYALISIDFYISQKSYAKKGMKIGNNTIRFDISIDTNCPDDFIFLEQEISVQEDNKNMNIFEKHGEWKEIREMGNITEHDFSQDDLGIIGFGKENMVFEYGWLNEDSVKTLYKYTGNKFTFYFAYKNSGHIIQDPYISLPVPVFIEIEKNVVNFLMEHILSISIGLSLSLLLIAFPKFIRKIRL